MNDTANHHLTALSAAFNQRNWTQTLNLANRLLPKMPQHPLLRYIAGVAEMELLNMPMALTHLHIAAQLEPHRVDFLVQFAKALNHVMMRREARSVADKAMSLLPVDHIALDTLGVIYTQAHAHEDAASAFRKAKELAPSVASYRFNLATSLVAIGEIAEAEAELENCIRIAPDYWKAYLSLSQLRKQTPIHNNISRMYELLAGSSDDQDAQIYLNMALAKEHEDCSDYSAAFRHYTLGKTAAGSGLNYASARDKALFAAITETFASPRTASAGHTTSEPIFIVGMPRSGTTLVERIISSHPNVFSAGELMNFGVALKHASGSRTPFLLDVDTVTRAQQLDWRSLGEEYLVSTRPSTGNTSRFIDKLPHNFLYLGWIARALPNAKIVCLRRDPLDTCLSNFRQLLPRQSPYYGYSFNLLSIGRYYAMFDRLMNHWQQILPGRILEVQYEDLVLSQESTTHRLLDFCNLPWNENCLHFQDNNAPVNTASAVQVRGPIYRNSLQRWRMYDQQLGALRAVLRECGIEPPS